MKATYCHVATWPYLHAVTSSQEKIKGEEHLLPCRDMRRIPEGHIMSCHNMRRIPNKSLLLCRDMATLD